MSDEEEQGRKSTLAKARQNAKTKENASKEATPGSPVAALSSLKDALSIRKKISNHWRILFAAAIFDVFGLIPFLGVIFNFAFGLLLWLSFGSKKKIKPQSDLIGIVLPIFLGSVVDFFISILPVNIGAALFRIYMSQE